MRSGLDCIEVFTGKRSLYRRKRSLNWSGGGTSTPSKPSSVVKDSHPAVERVLTVIGHISPRPGSCIERGGGALLVGDPGQPLGCGGNAAPSDGCRCR